MRRTVQISALLALIWGGWWWFATTTLQSAVTGWLGNQRAAGLEADVAQMARGGFPLRIGATLRELRLTDPAAGTALRIPLITVETPVYWPGHATLRLPDAPVTMLTPQGTLTLGLSGAEAALRLRPGPALQLRDTALSGSDITLDLEGAPVLRIASFAAQIRQDSAPETYRFDLTAVGLTLDALSVAPGRPVTSEPVTSEPVTFEPVTFEPIMAQITVSFDRPWDRSALQAARPQPRSIAVAGITAGQGSTGFTLDGDLVVNADGIPSGTLRLRLRDWQRMFDMALSALPVPPDWTPTAARVLAAMAQPDGTLDLEITVDQGQMRIGFVPLGPAPRLSIP